MLIWLHYLKNRLKSYCIFADQIRKYIGKIDTIVKRYVHNNILLAKFKIYLVKYTKKKNHDMTFNYSLQNKIMLVQSE